MLTSLQVIAQRPDAPEYALPGTFAVGTREYVIESDADADDGSGRDLPATIWYPAQVTEDAQAGTTYTSGALIRAEGDAISNAIPDLSGGPYPLVVFSHGSGGIRFQSLFLTEHLASHGFVVMAVDHVTNTLGDTLLNGDAFSDNIALNYAYRPLDVLRVIEYAETLTSDGELADLIDMERIAVSGHSFGGYTAVVAAGAQLNTQTLASYCAQLPADADDNVCFILDEAERIAEVIGLDEVPQGAWPAMSDPRIDAVVALAPWNGPIFDPQSLAENIPPTLFIVGSEDEITIPERDAYIMYRGAVNAIPKAQVTLENGGHYLFVDRCSDLAVQFGLFRSCSDQVWDMERAHDLTNHFATAFLLSVLYEDEQASAALEPEQVDFIGVDYEAVLHPVQELVPEVISERPHDTQAFTQGLLLHEGSFYESTGLYGQSSLREVDPQTGEVLRRIDLSEEFFAEGLALIGDRLLQLTWRENVAFEFNVDTFEFVTGYQYNGEGWGLCYDGEWLYMSNGSDMLTRRDPISFEPREEIPVTLRGEPVFMLNELECVGDAVYANVWQTDFIVQIDKATGNVVAQIDATGLLSPEEEANLDNGAVLNGIAYDEVNEVFLITGKLWPKVFEVRFVPAEEQ